MSPVNLSRVIMGTVIMAGLLFYKPVAYVTAAMMIVAGLLGVWLLEGIVSKVLGARTARNT